MPAASCAAVGTPTVKRRNPTPATTRVMTLAVPGRRYQTLSAPEVMSSPVTEVGVMLAQFGSLSEWSSR